MIALLFCVIIHTLTDISGVVATVVKLTLLHIFKQILLSIMLPRVMMFKYMS